MPPSGLRGRPLRTVPISCCGYRDIACSFIVFLELCWIQMFGSQCTDFRASRQNRSPGASPPRVGASVYSTCKWAELQESQHLTVLSTPAWPRELRPPVHCLFCVFLPVGFKTHKKTTQTHNMMLLATVSNPYTDFEAVYFFHPLNQKYFFPSICTKNSWIYPLYIGNIYKAGLTKSGLPWWLRW